MLVFHEPLKTRRLSAQSQFLLSSSNPFSRKRLRLGNPLHQECQVAKTANPNLFSRRRRDGGFGLPQFSVDHHLSQGRKLLRDYSDLPNHRVSSHAHLTSSRAQSEPQEKNRDQPES